MPPERPAGDGRPPLATVCRDGQRRILAALSAAARAAGLMPGMALSQALALAPDLIVRAADPPGDAARLTRLALHAARCWSPVTQVCGTDGLWFDITGCAHLFGGERGMAAHILRFCARIGHHARIAIADSVGAAHALARFGEAALTLCPPGEQARMLAPLPVAALRLDPALLATLRRLGIDTVGALAALPRAPLGRRFGQEVLLRLDQAFGRVAEPIAAIVPGDAPAATLRFAEPIADAAAIQAAVTRLTAELAGRLAERGLGARLLRLDGARVDGADQYILVGTARASRDPAHLDRLFRLRLERIEPGYGLDTLRLVAMRCEMLAPQPIATGPETDLAPLIDRLAGRTGTSRIYRVGAVESDVPERSVQRGNPLVIPSGWPDRWPRPVRLLSPPEPVDHVLVELPDLPPRRFRWRGRLHTVVRADGPERIYGEWWKRPAEAEAVRDYFRVEDETGARFWLFRRGDGEDGRSGDMRWYLHGLFG